MRKIYLLLSAIVMIVSIVLVIRIEKKTAAKKAVEEIQPQEAPPAQVEEPKKEKALPKEEVIQPTIEEIKKEEEKKEILPQKPLQTPPQVSPQETEQKKQAEIAEKKERADFHAASLLLQEQQPKKALDIIKKYENEVQLHPKKEGKRWLNLLIDAYTELSDSSALMSLQKASPEAFAHHEKASLIVAYAYLDEKKVPELEAIRKSWAGKETLHPAWLYLDADIFLMKKNVEAAKKLLASREFQGKADVGRLLRLAHITMFDQPKEALIYLLEAQKLDSKNPQVHLLRAKILEAGGQNKAAIFEYSLAIQLAPLNPTIREELADFYQKQGQMDLALQLWKDSLTPPSKDSIWLKLLFWNKVYKNVSVNWRQIPQPTSSEAPFIQYMINLPEGVFWHEEAFKQVEHSEQYLQNEQITFWLRLINFLKLGKENEAIELLQKNPFHEHSWDPLLEQALLKVLIFRKSGVLPSEPLVSSYTTSMQSETQQEAELKQRHYFFKELNDYCKKLQNNPKEQAKVLPPKVVALLKSDDAFSAIFLADSWLEAAIDLQKETNHSKELPNWYPFDMTQAIRRKNGSEAALAYARRQPESDINNLLIAQLLLDTGRETDATRILKKLAALPSEVGFQAAYFLANFFVEHGDYKEVKQVLNLQPSLGKSISGQEILARIALKEGKKNRAFEIYSRIEKDSFEAKSYLAQKAFEEKDLVRAKKLTEELLQQYPTNPEVQKNYMRIIEAEKK